jgi:hypothetical protein
MLIPPRQKTSRPPPFFPKKAPASAVPAFETHPRHPRFRFFPLASPADFHHIATTSS